VLNQSTQKSAGRVPPDAFLFVSQQKGSKKWPLLRRASLSPIYFLINSRPMHRSGRPFSAPKAGPDSYAGPITIGIREDEALTNHSTIAAPTGRPLNPWVAESIGHQPFGAESTSPVFSFSAINRTETRQPTCSTQWKSFFCFVFFAIQRK
jgi:hypothetical protein